jgi:hypothetical protein
MRRTGLGRTGCIVWVSLLLLVVALIWKSLQFFILGPAEVKAALNDAYDRVRVLRGSPDIRRIAFYESWAALYDTTESDLVGRCSRPVFDGDTVYVQYSDTFHLPAIPDSLTAKTFRIYRLFV